MVLQEIVSSRRPAAREKWKENPRLLVGPADGRLGFIGNLPSSCCRREMLQHWLQKQHTRQIVLKHHFLSVVPQPMHLAGNAPTFSRLAA